MARLKVGAFPALDEETVAKLYSRNIFTVYDFMLLTCDDLIKRTGLTFKEIENLREQMYKDFGGKRENTVDLYEREHRDVIPTGIKDLDSLLDGGLHCRQMYEVCGSSSAGKSQLCHWIAVYATLNASTRVHYIDASNNFCVSRIQMILETQQCSNIVIARVMSNIRVYRATGVVHVFSILQHLSGTAPDREDGSRTMVIVDSLSVLFAVIANDNYNDLNPTLNNFSSACRFVADLCRAVVITVNSVRLEGGGRTLIGADKEVVVNMKPFLSNYWVNVPNVRLLINNLDNNEREISVWRSCQLENGKKCTVHIRDEGIS